jgi:predicted  nucleic acid-binding Zn-ribbon protein
MQGLSAVFTVRCLGCGAVYAKPAGGGTAAANPGCPKCGYVGWVTADRDVSRSSGPLRSASGRLHRRSGRSG